MCRKKESEIKKIMNKQAKIFLILSIICMSVIFFFSNQPADTSENTSKGIVSTFIDMFNLDEGKTEEEKTELINQLNKIERKLAHYTIYLVSGVLLFPVVKGIRKKEDIKTVLISIAIGATYAITDEIHQIFIEGRTCLPTDVLIDTLGVTTGVFIFMLISKCINKKSLSEV